jgi:hypothetical protein
LSWNPHLKQYIAINEHKDSIYWRIRLIHFERN